MAKAKVQKNPSPPLPPARSAGLCGRWIIVLIFRGYDNNAIRADLGADDLPCPKDNELNAMRAAHVPKGSKSKSSKNTAVLEKLGISAFFTKTDEAEQAIDLLRQPRVRELVEAGLIGGVPVTAIVHTLKTYLKYETSPEAIALFHSVFFDTLAVSRAQLRVAVHERVRLAITRMVDDEEDEVAARRAIAADARITAISLPSTPLAWSAIMLQLGHCPGRRELGDVIVQMESLAVVRAGESLLRGEPGDERRAEAFVGVLQKIHEIRQGVISPESELTTKLTSFRVAHEVKPMMTVAELRAGGDEVTVDMGPPVTESGGT